MSQTRLIDLTPADLPRIKELEDTVWFEVLPGGTPEDLSPDIDFRHARALERVGDPLPGEAPQDRPPLVGIYGAFDMTVTVPGPEGTLRSLPMDGLTWVGVHPDHRRQGLLTRLMTDHLHRVHDRGEAALAGLHASEAAIYGRFGYGCSSLDVKLTLGRGTELTAPPAVVEGADGVQVHMVTAPTAEGMAALHEAHLATARATLGAVTRPDAMSGTWWRDHPKARGTKEPRRLLLSSRDGQTTGYAVLRRESKWEEELPAGEVSVVELGAVDHASLLALVRRLVDFDLTSKTTLWARTVDDPVIWWAGGPRSVGIRAYDSLWLRLVDLPRALTERGYAAPCDLVLDVTDDLCPWNAGRWRLTVADGRATCERTDEEADLCVPTAVLAAAYGGGRTVASQVPALGGSERTPGAIRRLSRAMRADTEPYGAIGF
ncbi:GNAT family N-acetyltransferase [Ornithinimicrobium sp. LYQ121]|uniref:GNAT family N-acetyltransferase n=1 Tax=Ornithinimicrobium sp. LYQ121 TaxID=3378801 RepID=UPI003852C326